MASFRWLPAGPSCQAMHGRCNDAIADTTWLWLPVSHTTLQTSRSNTCHYYRVRFRVATASALACVSPSRRRRLGHLPSSST